MTDLTTADALASARGYADWAALTALDRTRALIRAGDYLRRYNLRPELDADEQEVLDIATLFIARDLLTNDTPLSIRSSAQVLKESKEGAGFKKATEYAEGPVDPYPFVTDLLRPLLKVASGGSFIIGRMVR